MIAGVLLDLDDTLVDRTGAVSGWLTTLGGAHAASLMAADAGGYGDRNAFFQLLAERMGWTGPEARAHFRKGLLERLQPMPGATQLIERLSSRYTIAVATNGTVAMQRAKLAASGLDRLVPTCVISEAIGVAKPATPFFAHAVQVLGTTPATTLMIGDHPINDVAGAKSAGLRTCWLRNPRHPVPREADLCVDQLDAVELA
jgi:putative hydrolase of the HAD superfamily